VLKPNWKSPAIRMAMGMIITGMLWCAGVAYTALGHPYEPFILLFFSMGLMMSSAGAVCYVQAVRHERALDELIRKRNVEPGSIKLSAA
jgi:hypothetical protein